MLHLGTWVNGGLGSARGTDGLDGFKGLFQPQGFCDIGLAQCLLPCAQIANFCDYKSWQLLFYNNLYLISILRYIFLKSSKKEKRWQCVCTELRLQALPSSSREQRAWPTFHGSTSQPTTADGSRALQIKGRQAAEAFTPWNWAFSLPVPCPAAFCGEPGCWGSSAPSTAQGRQGAPPVPLCFVGTAASVNLFVVKQIPCWSYI